MDFSREESLIVVKISEAIQQGRLNAAAEHVTARSVALASHTRHWTTALRAGQGWPCRRMHRNVVSGGVASRRPGVGDSRGPARSRGVPRRI